MRRLSLFISQHEQIGDILKRAESINIDKVKCRTMIKLLKFKLSDAFHFFIEHNKRHMLQAERNLTL